MMKIFSAQILLLLLQNHILKCWGIVFLPIPVNVYISGGLKYVTKDECKEVGVINTEISDISDSLDNSTAQIKEELLNIYRLYDIEAVDTVNSALGDLRALGNTFNKSCENDIVTKLVGVYDKVVIDLSDCINDNVRNYSQLFISPLETELKIFGRELERSNSQQESKCVPKYLQIWIEHIMKAVNNMQEDHSLAIIDRKNATAVCCQNALKVLRKSTYDILSNTSVCINTYNVHDQTFSIENFINISKYL